MTLSNRQTAVIRKAKIAADANWDPKQYQLTWKMGLSRSGSESLGRRLLFRCSCDMAPYQAAEICAVSNILDAGETAAYIRYSRDRVSVTVLRRIHRPYRNELRLRRH